MVYVAADAKSQNVRAWIINYLEAHHLEHTDLGAKSEEDPIDITEFIPKVAREVLGAKSEAILTCGNGIGVSIGMNRFKGIRAALATNPDLAEWGKVYDDCNVLCLPAWTLKSEQTVSDILDTWFNAVFEPIPRRVARIERMDTLTSA